MRIEGKILVAEAPDPPVGIWRPITNLLDTEEECFLWLEHIKAQELSDVRVVSVPLKGDILKWYVEAKRRG